MKKPVLFLILIFILQCSTLFGQSFDFFIGKGLQNNGDYDSWHYEVFFKQRIKTSKFAWNIGVSHTAGNRGGGIGGIVNGDYPPGYVAPGDEFDYPYFGSEPGLRIRESDGKLLNVKSDFRSATRLSALVSYRFGLGEKLNLNLAVGPALNYIKEVYTAEQFNATVSLGSESARATVVVPFYYRLLTYGLDNKLDLNYPISKRVSLNLGIRALLSRDGSNIWAAGLGTNVKIGCL